MSATDANMSALARRCKIIFAVTEGGSNATSLALAPQNQEFSTYWAADHDRKTLVLPLPQLKDVLGADSLTIVDGSNWKDPDREPLNHVGWLYAFKPKLGLSAGMPRTQVLNVIELNNANLHPVCQLFRVNALLNAAGRALYAADQIVFRKDIPCTNFQDLVSRLSCIDPNSSTQALLDGGAVEKKEEWVKHTVAVEAGADKQILKVA